MGYTKLFNSILASTVWNEQHTTRIVWITMLAMKDRDGIVEGSLPGLAVLARVTIQECKRAIEILSAPDPDSRTKVSEGRRIEPHADGWRIINHDLYQDRGSAEDQREKTRLRVERHRARKAAIVTGSNGVQRSATVEMTSGSGLLSDSGSDSPEKKRERLASARSVRRKMAEKPPDVEQSLWDAYMAVRCDKPKGMPFTKLALEALQRRAAKLGITTTQFLQGAVDNNWLSFDPSWVKTGPAPMSRFGGPKSTEPDFSKFDYGKSRKL
jgi:hypothetical protein